MQVGRILLLALLCAVSTLSYAQNAGSVRGVIKNQAGEPALSLTVKVKNTPLVTISDNSGAFVLSNVAPGSYILEVTGLGYKAVQRAVSVAAGRETTVTLTVEEASVDMDEVTVTGRSAVTETNRQAYNVTAIDAKQLYNTTLNLADALDRVAGVRVRESGGVGSNFNLSLNGLSGNRVRYFIDGIPMEGYGSSFQINNIPINAAERVEVYKGVVPIWLGSDALGGAINIVTGNRQRNYVDASYSFGSFNTHRSVINGALTSKSGLTVQLSAFQNYSDNNYKVNVESADINTGVYSPVRVRRFNDTYHNETLIGNVGVVDKWYADKLLFGITVGKNYKEIQTGARMEAVFGAWHRRGTILMPTFKYKKENLVKGLDVTLNANFNFGTEQNVDTVNRRYNWVRESKPPGTGGGERSLSLYKYQNNNGLATAMLNYRLSEHQSLAVSDVFNTFDRKGSNILNPRDFQRPQKTQKNVLGLGYSYSVDNSWSMSVFGKAFTQVNVMSAEDARTTTNKFGYGAAGTYFFTPSLQVKASYELANRLPETYEIFGDVENQQGNPNLKPEQSHNLNLGASYNFAFSPDDRFLINANAVYRNTADFIFTRLDNNQQRLIADNRDGVRTLGGDAEIQYSHKKFFTAGATMTYQQVVSTQKYEINPASGLYYTSVSPLYLAQMPNMPFLFGNASASVTLPDLGSKGSRLSIGYNLLYVYRFWLFWPALGNKDITTADPKRVVPMQLSHDLNIVYSLKNGRYNLGLECRNVTDALLYDNFSLQKPGRGFYGNFRYYFSNSK